MKHITTLIVLLSVFFLCLLTGKNLNAQERPEWCNGNLPNDLPNKLNKSYVKVYSESGYDVNDLRYKIYKHILIDQGFVTSQSTKIEMRDNLITVTSDNDLLVKAYIIAEYIDHNSTPYPYTVYQLVQIAKNPTFHLENIYVSNEYPFSARVFVPGMAQIHKGSNKKGITFIAGEVAFVGGIVTAECLRVSYENKMNSTHNAADIHDYEQNANICTIVRNISIAGAAAVYIWNIIDGVVAKGKQRPFLGRAQMQVAPFATYNGGGLAMNINF